MRRLFAILFAVWISALGSGAVSAAHEAQHAREDAAAAKVATDAGRPVPDHQDHDDDNCPVHAQIHLPLIAAGHVPLLVLLGLFVAFVSMLAASLAGAPVPCWLTCRGPPNLLPR